MRYFFQGRAPETRDVLVMESGSPDTALRAVSNFSKAFPGVRFHLCTCQAEVRASIYSTVVRVTDYPSGWQKLRLLFSFWNFHSKILVILCTGDPILFRWKVLAALLVPAKILIVNENGDYFWFDWHNRRTIRRFLAVRWGVNRSGLGVLFLRLLIFPFTLLYLLATAGFLYLRRWRRLLQWKIQGTH